MRSLFITSLATVAVAAVCVSASAQTPSGDQGRVAAVSAGKITLVNAAGVATTIKLQPDARVLLSKPIKISDIKPGSYIGTTNYAKPDGTGRSLEVHVATSGPDLDFVMDANAGTTMTNGTVETVVESNDGRVLSVNHGNGVRKITVPPGVPVVFTSMSDLSHVAPGAWAKVATVVAPTGQKMQMITIEAH